MTSKYHVIRVMAVTILAMAALTAALVGRIDVVSSQDAPPPTVNELADGVYQWFSFNYNSLVVVSGDDVLISEPANAQRGEMLKEFVASLTDNPVSHIVLTHEHYDHVGGTGLFPEATVYCHVNCQPIFDLAAPPFNDVPEVDETFTDSISITVGSTAVELHYLGPGDGDATTVIYMPEEKIALTSDMYEDQAITHASWLDDKNYTGTRHILNTLSGWDLNHAITAHSASTDPQVLRDNAQFYNDLYDVVHQAMVDVQAEGGPFAIFGVLDSLPASIQLDQYSGWTNYDSSFTRHASRMMFSIFHAD